MREETKGEKKRARGTAARTPVSKEEHMPPMSETHRIYVIGWAPTLGPDGEPEAGTGGFEWFVTWEQVTDYLRDTEYVTLGHEYRIVALDVPSDLSGDDLTGWLDGDRDLWEPLNTSCLLGGEFAEVEQLTKERDSAQAEVERLTRELKKYRTAASAEPAVPAGGEEVKEEWKPGDLAYVPVTISEVDAHGGSPCVDAIAVDPEGRHYVVNYKTVKRPLRAIPSADKLPAGSELTTTRDDLQRTAAAMWEPLRGVAAALGYHRASASDFGEVDEAAVRDLAETTRYLRRSSGLSIESLERDCREARVAALRAQYERDELRERVAKLEEQGRRLAAAERAIGRAAIDRAMEVE